MKETKTLGFSDAFFYTEKCTRFYRSEFAKKLEWLGRKIVFLNKNQNYDSLLKKIKMAGLIVLSIPGALLRKLASQDRDAFQLNIKKDDHFSIEKKNIQILTLNTGLLPSWISTNFNHLRDSDQRAVEISKKILENYGDYDVICFQEVFTEKAQAILIEQLKEKFPHIVHHIGDPYIGFGSGLMVFSKLSISDVYYEKYGNLVWEDAATCKGFVSVKLQIGMSKCVRVYTTHAHAGAGPQILQKIWGTDSKKRQQQLQAIGNHKKHVENQDKQTGCKGVILTGDINLDLSGNEQEKTEYHSDFFKNTAFKSFSGMPQSTVWKKDLLDKHMTEFYEFQGEELQEIQPKIIDVMEPFLGHQFDLEQSTKKISTIFGNATDHLAVEGSFKLSGN